MSITINAESLKNFKFQKALETKIQGLFENRSLKVGFFASAKYPNGEAVSDVAAYNEFGTSAIPPRPFIRNAKSENEKKWANFLARDLNSSGNADLAFSRLGELVRNDIIVSINKTTRPPNSADTIARKGSSHPLIDTGFLKSSVTYEVNKGKK